MKPIRRFPLPLLSGLGAILLAVCSCRAKDEPATPTPPDASSDRTPAPAPTMPAGPAEAPREDPDTATASATWASIKDCTFEQRADFVAGLNLMMKRVESAIATLNARRVTMKDESAKDWDFNMKELNNARDYLVSTGSDLEKATESNWADAKLKVAQAWDRVRSAYDKVTHSTTS
jgi:hypothetical protein